MTSWTGRRWRGGWRMAEIHAALEVIFEAVFGRKIEIFPELSARDVPGWDSFRQIDIILAAEARFGVEFSTAELDGLRNVGDLAAVLAARLGGDGSVTLAGK